MKVDVLHIAKLANLTLTKEEVEQYEQQLSSILAYIDKLQTLDTKDTKETSQVTGLENITVNDKTEPSLSQEEALSNAKDTHNGFLKVKGILGNES